MSERLWASWGFPATGQAKDIVDAKDFAQSTFRVTIARCQQAALDQAQMSVPDPARQLELLSARRKKSGKRGASTLSHNNR